MRVQYSKTKRKLKLKSKLLKIFKYLKPLKIFKTLVKGSNSRDKCTVFKIEGNRGLPIICIRASAV